MACELLISASVRIGFRIYEFRIMAVNFEVWEFITQRILRRVDQCNWIANLYELEGEC